MSPVEHLRAQPNIQRTYETCVQLNARATTFQGEIHLQTYNAVCTDNSSDDMDVDAGWT